MKTYEQFVNEEYGNIMNLKQLAEMGARTQHLESQGMAADVFFRILLKDFRREGDEGVINKFKDMTKLNLDTIRKGRYYII